MKKWKLLPYCLCIFYILLCIPAVFSYVTEKKAHYYPDYPMIDLTNTFQKPSLSEIDYRLLFYQTGLSKNNISLLDLSALKQYQKNFFEPVSFRCHANSIISREESLLFLNENPILLPPLQNGDVLITSASHTFFWRNGHVAIVTNAATGETLESVVLGENSSFQNVRKWKKYPNFVILRLKDVPAETRNMIAQTASAFLYDIPYDFTVGILSKKEKTPPAINGTQCAHLVWEAFYLNDFDVDSDGGKLVTPSDIANSDLFEIVQIYGLNPDFYVDRS